MDACMLSHFRHVWLFVTLWTVACQPPLSMGFSRQEYWSGLPCLHPGDPPNPVIESASQVSCIRRWILLVPPAAAAKSLQSCPTLCDPIDGSLPGSPILGILQARTLEWVAISFSNAEKWKWSRSVVSDPQWPHGLQPSRLLCPWDFPGKSKLGNFLVAPAVRTSGFHCSGLALDLWSGNYDPCKSHREALNEKVKSKWIII